MLFCGMGKAGAPPIWTSMSWGSWTGILALRCWGWERVRGFAALKDKVAVTHTNKLMYMDCIVAVIISSDSFV